MDASSSNIVSTSPPDDRLSPRVTPLPWQRSLLDYLQSRERDLWDWFSSNRVRTEHTDSVRLNLLRTAYRLDRESRETLYAVVDDVAERMSIGVPVTLYQAQNPESFNASLAYLPDEAHVVLHGAVRELLTDAEFSGLLVHELAHHELYSLDDGAWLISEQILLAMLTDRDADAPHTRTWRNFRLYMELYCDRRALDVTDDLDAVIRQLVKIHTGLKDVSAAAYLSQAEEILADDHSGSDGITHPEMFIRAKALSAWNEDPDNSDTVIRPLIEGPIALQTLDLLRQQEMTDRTRRFVKDFLSPAWLRSDLVVAHAQRFSEDGTFTPGDSSKSALESNAQTTEDSPTANEPLDDELKRFLCYVLLDFVTIDPDLEDAPLAAAFLFSRTHDLESVFIETATKELSIGKRQFQKIQKDAAEIVAAAAQEQTE